MEEKKYTKKDYLMDIIARIKGDESRYTDKELLRFCEKECIQLDKRSARELNRSQAKKDENQILLESIYEFLTTQDGFVTRDAICEDVAKQFPDKEYSVAKITSRITALVKEGRVQKSEILVDRAGEKHKCKGYRAL